MDLGVLVNGPENQSNWIWEQNFKHGTSVKLLLMATKMKARWTSHYVWVRACKREWETVCIANLLWLGSLGQAASIQHEGPLKIIEAFGCCLHAFYLCFCGNFRFSLKLRYFALFSFDSFIGGIYSHLLHVWATAAFICSVEKMLLSSHSLRKYQSADLAFLSSSSALYFGIEFLVDFHVTLL